MASQYKLITSEFIEAYHANPSQFQQLIKTAFDKSKEIDGRYGIDIMFLQILAYYYFEFSVQEIKYMIDLGADPAYYGGKALFWVSCYSTSDAASYLIENYNLNIDSEDLGMLYYCHEKASLDTLRLFLDKGIILKNSDVFLLSSRRPGFIDVLVEKGYDIKMMLQGISAREPHRCENKEGLCQFIIDQIRKDDLILDKKLVNDLFSFVIGCGEVSMDDVMIFINAGMDPRYDNDKFFVRLCRFGSKIPRYFINEYGVDVNACDGLALTNAIISNNPSTINLLLESGIRVTDGHILEALYQPGTLDMLVGYNNITDERISKLLINKLFSINGPLLETAKSYIRKGIDLNQIILDLMIDSSNKKFEKY